MSPGSMQTELVALLGAAHAPAIARACEAIARAWPELRVPPATLAAAWRSATGDDLVDLGELQHGDFYLAVAAVEAVPQAEAALERQILAPVAAGLVRRGWERALVDDVMQIVRYRLLVGKKLASYRGKGSLAGWVRVVAVREAMARRPQAPPADSVGQLVAPLADPGAELLARSHGALVRQCLSAAVAGLGTRERAALRMEVLDQASHEAIAQVFGVHRTTVLRWLEAAREHLASELRRGLARTLAAPASDVDSLLRALAGQADLSLASLLASG